MLKGYLAIIQKTLTAACRMIIPSWKATPKATLWKKADIPPAELLLQQITARNENRWMPTLSLPAASYRKSMSSNTPLIQIRPRHGGQR